MGPHTAVVLALGAPHGGNRAHPAEVVLKMACWVKSSRKQAPAYILAQGRTPTEVKLAQNCIRTRGPHWHMLQEGTAVTGTRHCGRARKCWYSKWPTEAAAGASRPRQMGLPPGDSSQNSSPAGLWWEQPQARHVAGAKADKVSTFTSRHRQQRWSPALALYMLAAGGGGRKLNRGKLARWAK